jgi:hypothetical protein
MNSNDLHCDGHTDSIDMLALILRKTLDSACGVVPNSRAASPGRMPASKTRRAALREGVSRTFASADIGAVLETADSPYASPVNPGEGFGVRFEFDPVQQATLVVPTR